MAAIAVTVALPTSTAGQSVNIGADCGTINYRNNGNGGTSTCPGVSGTGMAANFVGTPYATAPSSTKTGDIRIRWNVSGTLYPPAITRIYETQTGVTVLTTLEVGPAGLPTQSGDVYYCFYNASNYNLQAAQFLTMEYSDPQTGSILGYCTFDFTQSIPTGVATLPLLPGNLNATQGGVAVTNQNLCAAADPAPFVANVLASGGTAPYTYAWERSTSNTFPSTGQNAKVTISGASGSSLDLSSVPSVTTYYRRVVYDANGNSAFSNVVSITPVTSTIATSTATTNVVCRGASTGAIDLSVSGGLGPYTYAWSGPSSFSATTQDLTGLTSGTYSVTVTDAGSCTATASATLTQPATAVGATATATNSLSGSSTGTATATPTGGTAPYTYSWSPSGGTAATATGLAAGTYTVTVTDVNGCSASASATVGTSNSAPTASVGSQVNVLCFGASTGSASIAVSGGTSPYTYSWSPSGGSAATASSLAAGTYTVTVTDSNNLSDTAVVIISEPTSAVTAATAVISDATCLSSTDGSAYVLPSGGVAPYTILWSNGSANDSIANLAPGTYSATITDANGCNFTGAAVVISTTDADCDGILNVTEGSANPTPTDTDNDGTPDWLDPDSDNDCIPDSFELTVDTDNDGTGDWRDLDSDDDLIPDNVEAAGSCANPVDTDNDGTPDFRELDSDNDGIPDTDEAGSQPNNPVDTDGDGTPDYRDLDSDNDGIPDEVERGPDGANPVDTDGDGTPDYRDLDADGDGILDAQESSTDDCDNDGIPNAMDADVCEIWIPQGFSPNGDGFNDTWEVNYLQYAAQNTVTIVNRWGEVVYRRDQYDNSWDGTPNTRVSGTADDGRVPDGTYYYIFTDLTHNRQYTGYVFITK